MKTLPAILLSFVLCACTTLSPNKAAVFQAAAKNLSAIGVDATLKAKPEYKPAIKLSLESLKAYKASNSGNIIELNQILEGLPIVQHSGFGGSLALANGISLLGIAHDSLSHTARYTNYSSYAQPITAGLIEGITMALDANK